MAELNNRARRQLNEVTKEADGYQPITDELLPRILAAIQGISYGSVELVFHDGKLVQLECSKKFRLDSRKSANIKE